MKATTKYAFYEMETIMDRLERNIIDNRDNYKMYQERLDDENLSDSDIKYIHEQLDEYITRWEVSEQAYNIIFENMQKIIKKATESNKGYMED